MANDEINEFDSLDIDSLEDIPTVEHSEVPNEQDDLIDQGTAGTAYNWNNAPEGTKAPPRVDLNGKTITILKAEIILPPVDTEWEKPRTPGSKNVYKYCTFKLYYDFEGQAEFYSGVRVFKKEVDGKIKYSHPTIMNDKKNQASRLKGIYADFKKKDINEVSLKEFMSFLNSKPKAVIKTEDVSNPKNGQTIKKNLIGNFVN